jgi:hypothetical protein
MTPAGGVAVSESCGAYLFTPQDFLDWGQPTAGSGYSGFGQASNAASAGPWNATSANGTGVALDPGASLLQRFDNTRYAWSTFFNAWVTPNDAETNQLDHPPSLPINTFAGHFRAPGSPTPVPDYGDNLIALLSPGSSSSLSLSFGVPVFGVGFRVSSGASANFIATVEAFDALGFSLGTYEVDATGLGGACAGLEQPFPAGNPVPCNDAPLIQFADFQGRIKSVSLTVNGSTALIDELQLQTDNVPEPATSLLIGTGILSLAGWLKRRESRAPWFSARS